MRSSLIRLPYLFGTVLVVGCPDPKNDDATTTNAETSSSEGGSTSAPTTTVDPSTTEGSSSSEGSAESSSSGPGDTTTGETGDPECGPGIDCGTPAPDGWFGPMIIAQLAGDAEHPGCPEGYVEGPVALEGFVDPGPAVCSCECTLGMANCTAYMYGHLNGSCNTYQYSNVTETCTNVNVPGYAQFYTYSNGVASCTNEKTEEFPPAQWESQIVTCKLADDAATCNGTGVCQPTPPSDFQAQACIYQQGDVGCPAGVYNTKHLYASGVDDTRDCGDCTCGSPAQNCAGNMMVFSQADCPGEPSSLVPSGGSCNAATGVAVAIDYGTNNECPVASQPQPMGEVQPVGAFTFCCMGA